MTPLDAIRGLLARQQPHQLAPLMELMSTEPDDTGRWLLRFGGVSEWLSAAEIVERFTKRQQVIELAQTDPYNYGFFYPAWDEVLWEIVRLRVANPGVPVEMCIAGANGSAKTWFASRVLVDALMQCSPTAPKHQRMIWSFALDEGQSETICQAAVQHWLPNEYKPDTGRLKTTLKQKLAYNESGGFTDNQFSLLSGGQMKFMFWSMDIKKLEGPRPVTVWFDEGMPVAWLDGLCKRLITASQETRALCPRWEMLLKQKEQDPQKLFPREHIRELLIGVLLGTYTFRDGYTDTVRRYTEEGTVVQRIEADPALLPRRDREGHIIGGEWMPKLVHCKDATRRLIYLHAWDNPMGGNWEGMKQLAKGKSRKEILWLCYGVAESSADTPFPNFNIQVHTRPPETWLPKEGTWWNAWDPVASGGRCWAGGWLFVCAEQWRGLAAGDYFIAHEYPQTNDLVPGIGQPGEWALPGGKGGVGIRGPAQKAWPVGFKFRADEIRRIERKLALMQGRRDVDDPQAMARFVLDGHRIMDSRAANTINENQDGGKTIIEYMEDNGLYFVPAGRDSGAAQGQTRVQPGEQMINDALWYDSDLAELDEKTGWLDIHPQNGRGPKLRISQHCTNLIDALKNYPGIMNGGEASAYKDMIDWLRYLLIAAPYHTDTASYDEFNDQLTCS